VVAGHVSSCMTAAETSRRLLWPRAGIIGSLSDDRTDQFPGTISQELAPKILITKLTASLCVWL
jgi:hypothetical protein